MPAARSAVVTGALRTRASLAPPVTSLYCSTPNENLVTGARSPTTPSCAVPDRFRNHLLADQLHILNVCFLTPEEMRRRSREYGAHRGQNIAYKPAVGWARIRSSWKPSARTIRSVFLEKDSSRRA